MRLEMRDLMYRLSVFVLALALVAGCSAAQSQSNPAPVASEQSGEQADASQVLDLAGQLALGTLRMEGTEHAVTTVQAQALLPLWQAMRSGSLQSEAETGAVLKQIENAMSSEQLEAIEAMRPTGDDLISWAQDQGVDLNAGQGFGALGEGQELPAELQERLREQFGGELPSPEEMAAMRAQRENMSEEERQAMRGSGQAGGRALGGLGQWVVLLNPLLELLTQRAEA